jgi:hypothetical protein
MVVPSIVVMQLEELLRRDSIVSGDAETSFEEEPLLELE